MSGETWVNGVKVSEQPLYDNTAKIVRSVFQNPRSQFFKYSKVTSCLRRKKCCIMT